MNLKETRLLLPLSCYFLPDCRHQASIPGHGLPVIQGTPALAGENWDCLGGSSFLSTRLTMSGLECLGNVTAQLSEGPAFR